jgi:hypothetical protein
MSICGKYSQHPDKNPDLCQPMMTSDSDPQVSIPTGFPMGIPVVTHTCALPYNIWYRVQIVLLVNCDSFDETQLLQPLGNSSLVVIFSLQCHIYIVSFETRLTRAIMRSWFRYVLVSSKHCIAPCLHWDDDAETCNS